MLRQPAVHLYIKHTQLQKPGQEPKRKLLLFAVKVLPLTKNDDASHPLVFVTEH